MKHLFTLVLACLLFSCGEHECRQTDYGEINHVRIDDEGEYHFETDYETHYDLNDLQVHISRWDIPEPRLFKEECRCKENQVCNNYSRTWQTNKFEFHLHLPRDYKIDHFDD